MRKRERETYQWEEEKIVMNRKKNLLINEGGSSWHQGVLRGREGERAMKSERPKHTIFYTKWRILIPLCFAEIYVWLINGLNWIGIW